MFIKAFNQVIENRDMVLENCEIVLIDLLNTETLETKIKEAESEHNGSLKLLKSYIDENATSKIDQNEYREKYSSYLEKYENKKSELENLQNLKFEKSIKLQKMKEFILKIKNYENITQEFDKKLLFATVDQIVVNTENVTFIFKNGLKIKI